MYHCWVSPKGEVIACNNHDVKAWKIILERFGIRPADVREPSVFLGDKRWIAYNNHPCNVGWWIYYCSEGPTQAQIDKVYELTGDIYDEVTGEFVRK